MKGIRLAINFLAKQVNGSLVIHDKETFRTELLKFGDKEISVTLKLNENNRTSQENRYYWAVIVKMISDEMGFIDQQQCHEYLKSRFLSEIVYVKIKGIAKEIVVPVSSTSLSISQFEDYLSKCRMFASDELSLYIPLPNEAEAY